MFKPLNPVNYEKFRKLLKEHSNKFCNLYNDKLLSGGRSFKVAGADESLRELLRPLADEVSVRMTYSIGRGRGPAHETERYFFFPEG